MGSQLWGRHSWEQVREPSLRATQRTGQVIQVQESRRAFPGPGELEARIPDPASPNKHQLLAHCLIQLIWGNSEPRPSAVRSGPHWAGLRFGTLGGHLVHPQSQAADGHNVPTQTVRGLEDVTEKRLLESDMALTLTQLDKPTPHRVGSQKNSHSCSVWSEGDCHSPCLPPPALPANCSTPALPALQGGLLGESGKGRREMGRDRKGSVLEQISAPCRKQAP